MSLRAWDSLSAEDQTDLSRCGAESSMFMRELWIGWEERSRSRRKAAGNVIIADIDRKPFEQAMTAIHAKALTTIRIKTLIERIRQVQ